MHRFPHKRTFVTAFLAGLSVVTLTSCDAIKERFRAQPDLKWQQDSTIIAGQPTLLFRIIPNSDTAAWAVPIATIGAQGFHQLDLGRRGRRLLDLEYMHSGSPLIGVHQGRQTPGVSLIRGMWEPTPLDTSLNCTAAFARLTNRNIHLATNKPPAPLTYSGQLGAAELQAELNKIPLLIAPTVGIATSMLQRYERTVHQVESGSGPSPSIVVVYNDPEVVADSVPEMGERPRHFVVILDKGTFGYRPSFTFKSVGKERSPRLRFLDYMDVTGDGMAEIIFGYQWPQLVQILKFEAEAWRRLVVDTRNC